MLRRFLLTALVAVAFLALSATAGATIVPQKSIAGIAPGMSQARVKLILGTPSRVRHGSNDFGAYTQFLYASPALHIVFQGNDAVTSISTASPKERTASGIGVGSTEAQVKAKVAHVVCKTESGFHHCFEGSFLPGKRVTDFRFRAGRVSEVSVGIVID